MIYPVYYRRILQKFFTAAAFAALKLPCILIPALISGYIFFFVIDDTESQLIIYEVGLTHGRGFRLDIYIPVKLYGDDELRAALRIHRILHELEEPYKEVFQLRVFGELSFRQIGSIFGKTETWARVTHHRARLKIIERMDNNAV